MRRLLAAAAAVLAIAACDSTSTATGTWRGRVNLSGAAWDFTVTLTQEGDSITGNADVSGDFHEGYFVNGNIVGDSVRIRLRPVEDADINIAAMLAGNHLTGVMWFNQNTGSTNNITLTRDPVSLFGP